jgi:hypothetical protein
MRSAFSSHTGGMTAGFLIHRTFGPPLKSPYTTPQIPPPPQWRLAGHVSVGPLPFAASARIWPMGHVMISRRLSTLLGMHRLIQAQLTRLTGIHRATIRKLYYDPTFASSFCITLNSGGATGISKVHSARG